MGVTEKGEGLSGAPPQAPNRSKDISGPLGAGIQKGVSKIRVYKYTHTHTFEGSSRKAEVDFILL